MVQLAAQWKPSLQNSFQLSINSLKIDTTGSQSQTWYKTTLEANAGDTITGIHDEITSTQTTIMLLYTHRL